MKVFCIQPVSFQAGIVFELSSGQLQSAFDRMPDLYAHSGVIVWSLNESKLGYSSMVLFWFLLYPPKASLSISGDYFFSILCCAFTEFFLAVGTSLVYSLLSKCYLSLR